MIKLIFGQDSEGLLCVQNSASSRGNTGRSVCPLPNYPVLTSVVGSHTRVDGFSAARFCSGELEGRLLLLLLLLFLLPSLLFG